MLSACSSYHPCAVTRLLLTPLTHYPKAIIRRSRFSQNAIFLSNVVQEAAEALLTAKKDKSAPLPPAGLQLSFPLSFEEGETWSTLPRFYRVEIHRAELGQSTRMSGKVDPSQLAAEQERSHRQAHATNQAASLGVTFATSSSTSAAGPAPQSESDLDASEEGAQGEGAQGVQEAKGDSRRGRGGGGGGGGGGSRGESRETAGSEGFATSASTAAASVDPSNTIPRSMLDAFKAKVMGSVSWQQRSHDLLSRTSPVVEDGVWPPLEPALAAVAPHGPVDYVIEIHPPLVIENLLPHRGVFEIMHTEASAGRKKMLWCDTLDHGDCVPIHTVGMDEPLQLLLNLGFCRSTGDGARIHVPAETDLRDKALQLDEEEAGGLANAVYSGFGLGGGAGGWGGGVREWVMNSGKSSVEDEINLVDRMGQKLVVHVQNKVSAGGQRHLTVYCPYWLVNLTQYVGRGRGS